MILLGNVIIALLLSFSVVIIGVFDLYPAINGESTLMASLFSILLDYAIFAFVINLIREIVKDLEDINGDTSQGMKTLAIVLGILKTTKLVSALGLMSIITLFVYTKTYLIFNNLFIATLTPFFSFWPLIFSLSKFGQLNLKKSFAA
jgi:4-hydroxybenzoate polyprenyltransferase